MRKIILLNLLCMFLFLISCNKSTSNYYNGTITEISPFKYEGEISPQLFMAADTFSYGSMSIIDSLLMVGTGKSKVGILSVYDIKSKKRLLSICQMGKGQHEYLIYQENRPYKCSETNHIMLNTFDGMRKLMEVDITESLSKGKMVVTKEEDYGDKYFRIMDYNSGITIFPNGRKIVKFLAYQKDSRDKEYSTPKYLVEEPNGETHDINLYPEPIYGVDDRIYPDVFYSSNVAFKPDGTKIIEAMHMIDLFSIIDAKSGKVKGFKGKGISSLEEISKMSYETLRMQPYYSNRIHASEHYFFIIKDNTFVKDTEEITKATPKPIIQIFNWEGEALAKLKVAEAFMYSLFFDEQTELLYTTNDNGDILYYDLKEVIKKIKS